MLRLHFLHHRKLLPKLCRCVCNSLTMFLQEALDRKDVFPGGILVPQTFGDMANWNSHVHALITDTCWDREGNVQPIPDNGHKILTVVYRGEHFHPTLARNFDVSGPLEWIARVTSHIPRKGAKQVIYYGAYIRIPSLQCISAGNDV